MSEKHLYEKHLAEKLQQLPPPPDVEQHWQEMKALLDEEMPRGGGFGRSRWWRLGIIAGLLLIGAWFTGTQYRPSGNASVPVAAQTPNTADVNKMQNRSGNAADPEETGNGANRHGQSKKADGQTSPVSGLDQLPAASPESGPMARANATRETRNMPGGKRASDEHAANERHDGNRLKSDVAVRTQDGPVPISQSPAVAPRGHTAGNKRNNTTGNDQTKQSNHLNKLNEETVHNNNQPQKLKDRNKQEPLPGADAQRRTAAYSPVREKISNTGSPQLAPADRVKVALPSPDLGMAGMRSSKSARSGRVKRAGSFAFGLSLPLAFPLGDQQALGFNVNAGANTVSDYLPAPHVQYHFNDKTYLQTEVQVMSPQFIRPILLYEQKTPQGGNYYLYNSIYARKLYYFNIPVGIHHSPFENFYLGTGLQFSTLLSGVGLYEETKRSANGQQTTLLNERYARLGGDSLSNRMNMAELRLMLDVNYYFNKFTVGLRYNQAFNNYVSFQLDNTSPYTFDKNKALQFYLRYNLWENVKPKGKLKGLLSSK